MYTIEEGSDPGRADVDAFVATINDLGDNAAATARTLFEPAAAITVARAPGRLDVMGGIADYSGSLVLQMPLREATFAGVQRTGDTDLRIVSLGKDAASTRSFDMPLARLAAGGQPISYAAAQALFRQEESSNWAAYAAGAVIVLMRECGHDFAGGIRILIDSAVPESMGVSSSAALEVATMSALAAAFELTVEPRDLAIYCQKVENLVAGAPCGIMDQLASCCGEQDRLLRILCQPAELQGAVAIPPGVAVWGLDSGVAHAVSGADYGSVRVGAFMGYRAIAALESFVVSSISSTGTVRVSDPLWHGYLANIPPSRFASEYADELPLSLRGGDFLEQYGGTTDPVTTVEDDRTYAIRIPTGHPVHEHFRVRAFAELLQLPPTDERLRLLGEMMEQSHHSYSACGLGADGTDRLVELVREAGERRGLYGAKITGGGGGGTVAVIGRSDAEDAIEEVAFAYHGETGHRPYVFQGSSPGAAAFGTITLRASGQLECCAES